MKKSECISEAIPYSSQSSTQANREKKVYDPRYDKENHYKLNEGSGPVSRVERIWLS